MIYRSIIKHLDVRWSYTFLAMSERAVQEVFLVKQAPHSKYLAQLQEQNGCHWLVVSLMSYTFSIIKCNVNNLQDLDRRPLEMMNINDSQRATYLLFTSARR